MRTNFLSALVAVQSSVRFALQMPRNESQQAGRSARECQGSDDVVGRDNGELPRFLLPSVAEIAGPASEIRRGTPMNKCKQLSQEAYVCDL